MVAGPSTVSRRRPSRRVRVALILVSLLLLAAAVSTGAHGTDSPGPLFAMGVGTGALAWWAHRRR